MRELDGRFVNTRVKGKLAIRNSAIRLAIRVRRYGEQRAVTPDERQWAARVADAVTTVIEATRER